MKETFPFVWGYWYNKPFEFISISWINFVASFIDNTAEGVLIRLESFSNGGLIVSVKIIATGLPA